MEFFGHDKQAVNMSLLRLGLTSGQIRGNAFQPGERSQAHADRQIVSVVAYPQDRCTMPCDSAGGL